MVHGQLIAFCTSSSTGQFCTVETAHFQQRPEQESGFDMTVFRSGLLMLLVGLGTREGEGLAS